MGKMYYSHQGKQANHKDSEQIHPSVTVNTLSVIISPVKKFLEPLEVEKCMEN